MCVIGTAWLDQVPCALALPFTLLTGGNILFDFDDSVKLAEFGLSKQLSVSAAVVPVGLGFVQPTPH